VTVHTTDERAARILLALDPVASDPGRRIGARDDLDSLVAEREALLDLAGIASDVSRYGCTPLRRLKMANALARLDALRQILSDGDE
jgi:MoxR-like ATPase